MIIDARATAWHHLFPSETSYTARSGPQPFRQAVEILSTGTRGQVLVSWGDRLQDLPNLSAYSGLVAINGRKISKGRLRDAGFPYVRRFAVLPSMQDPRWFIPLGAPQVAEEALRINTPFRLVPQLKHMGARLAARTGFSLLFRNQVIIAQRTMPPLEEALAHALGTSAFELSISSGTPGPARKPTIAVLAPNGQWLAFVKLSRSTISRNLVENEARCLRYLNSRPELAPYVPELLFDTEVDNVFVAAQRALPGVMPGSELTDAHRSLLELLVHGPDAPAIESQFMRSMRQRASEAASQDPRLESAVELVHRALRGVSLPRTLVHGDFTPWNLRQHNGAISAFDWEYGEIDGLPLLDEMQYRLQAGLLLKDWTEDYALDDLLSFQSVQTGGHYEPHIIRALQILSLLDALSRSITEGHPTSSAGYIVRANLVQRLLPHLEEDAR